MYKLCKTERSARRQREIENALLELMKVQHYDTISVTALCDKLDMPRKAFYRYFDGKEDALQALLEHTMAEYAASAPAVDAEGRRSLKRELQQFFAFWREHRTLLDALKHSGLLSKVVQTSMDFPIRDMVSLSKFLPGETEWSRPHIFKFAVCGLITMVLGWYQSDFSATDAEMAALGCRMLAHPLFPNLESVGIF